MKDTYDKEAIGENQVRNQIYSDFIGRNGKHTEFIMKYFSNWSELREKYDLIEKYNRLENLYFNLKLENMG